MMGSRRRSSSRIRPTFRMMAGVARDEPPNLRTLMVDVEKESITARRGASSWPLQKRRYHGVHGPRTEDTDIFLPCPSVVCVWLGALRGSAFEETGLLLRTRKRGFRVFLRTENDPCST